MYPCLMRRMASWSWVAKLACTFCGCSIVKFRTWVLCEYWPGREETMLTIMFVEPKCILLGNMPNMEIILFPFFCSHGTETFAIHISFVQYFHAIHCHVCIVSSLGTKKLKIQNTFSFPNLSKQWRNWSYRFTHIFGLAVLDGRGQEPFQKSQTHNPEHSQYKAHTKTSVLDICKIVQHIESCLKWGNEIPTWRLQAHGEHATLPASSMWGRPPGLLVSPIFTLKISRLSLNFFHFSLCSKSTQSISPHRSVSTFTASMRPALSTS